MAGQNASQQGIPRACHTLRSGRHPDVRQGRMPVVCWAMGQTGRHPLTFRREVEVSCLLIFPRRGENH